MYRVFRLPAAQSAKVDVLYADDVVGRQSLIVRDARSLGLSGDDRYVLLEGSEVALARAARLLEDIARPLEGAEAERVYHKIRSQDEDAAAGLGLIFGP